MSHRVCYHGLDIAPIMAYINTICTQGKCYNLSNKIVRSWLCFWHLLSLDGAEITAATQCGTDHCSICECH